MIRKKVNFHTGESEVHFADGPGPDYSICGCDLDGDTEYGNATITNEAVNCSDCLRLVKICKKIRLKTTESI